MNEWTIRLARASDDERVVEMAFKFLSSTQYGVVIRGVTPQSMRSFVEMVRDIGAIFVVEGRAENAGSGIIGMLAIASSVNPMSQGSEALELGWWMEPAHRGTRAGAALLVAAEEWATRKGLGCLKMVAPADTGNSEHLSAFYEHMGYVKVETVYQKFLSPAARVAGNGGGPLHG